MKHESAYSLWSKINIFQKFLSMNNIPLKIGEMGFNPLNVYTQDRK